MSDSLVMMALGDFRFGINTAAYQSLERCNTWRWETIDRLGAKPAKQYVGPGEERVSMDGTIYPAFRGGLSQIDAMRTEAGRGEPLTLVDGTGRAWGKFCLTEIRETRSVFFANGQPRKIEFSISLEAYGDDK